MIGNQVGTSIPPYLKRKLKRIAEIERISVSGLIAEAVQMYLDKWVARVKTDTTEEELKKLAKLKKQRRRLPFIAR